MTGSLLHLQVYPRACGGTGAMVWITSMAMGLSPRVRGNRHTAS